MIRLTIPSIEADDLCAVQDAVASGFLVQGARVAAFADLPHAVAVSSGTAALHLALKALDIGPGAQAMNRGDFLAQRYPGSVLACHVAWSCATQGMVLPPYGTMSLDEAGQVADILRRDMEGHDTAMTETRRSGRIVVLGCLEETLDTLSYLYYLGGEVDALVTLSEAEARRANSTNWVDLAPFAADHGLALHGVEKYGMTAEGDFALMQSLEPEVVIVLGWQRLVPEQIIRLAHCGVLGFHGSANMLPWGRGRSPINWSIIEGRNRFILHMFMITPGVDDGDIVGFEIYDICPEDTCRSVYYKTAMAQARLVHRFLPSIRAGTCPRYPQMGDVFHYPKRTPEDGRIRWQAPAEEVCRLVRAVTRPYPGAFTTIQAQKLMVWDAKYFGDNLLTTAAAPGTVVFVSSNSMREFVVQCGRGAVLVTDYEASSPLKPGDLLQ